MTMLSLPSLLSSSQSKNNLRTIIYQFMNDNVKYVFVAIIDIDFIQQNNFIPPMIIAKIKLLI